MFEVSAVGLMSCLFRLSHVAVYRIQYHISKCSKSDLKISVTPKVMPESCPSHTQSYARVMPESCPSVKEGQVWDTFTCSVNPVLKARAKKCV